MDTCFQNGIDEASSVSFCLKGFNVNMTKSDRVYSPQQSIDKNTMRM